MPSKSVSPSPFWPEVCALLAWSCPSMDIWPKAAPQKLRTVTTEGLERKMGKDGKVNFGGLFVFFTLHNIISIQYLPISSPFFDIFRTFHDIEEKKGIFFWIASMIFHDVTGRMGGWADRHWVRTATEDPKRQTHLRGFARLHSRQLVSLHWLPTHPRRWKLKEIYGKITSLPSNTKMEDEKSAHWSTFVFRASFFQTWWYRKIQKEETAAFPSVISREMQWWDVLTLESVDFLHLLAIRWRKTLTENTIWLLYICYYHII